MKFDEISGAAHYQPPRRFGPVPDLPLVVLIGQLVFALGDFGLRIGHARHARRWKR